jgi:hypothetical protein
MSFGPAAPPRLADRAHLQVVEKLYEQEGITNVMEITEKARKLACS